MSNSFLGSQVTSSDISTETTQAKILTSIESGISILPTSKIFVETDAGDLVDVSIDAANVTGQIPVTGTLTVDSVKITDFEFGGGGQTDDVNVNLTNTSIDTNATIQNASIAVTQSGVWAVNSTIQNASLPVTQSGTWSVDIDGQPISVSQAGSWGTNTDITEIGGTAVAVNTGTGNAGTIRVMPASDGPALRAVGDLPLGTETGNVLLGRRNDVLTGDAGQDQAYDALKVNSKGALYVDQDTATNNWVNVLSGFYSPFDAPDRFVEIDTQNTLENDSAYYFETAATDRAIVRTAQRLTLIPGSVTRITMSAQISYNQAGVSANDGAFWGIFSTDPAYGAFPKTWCGWEGRRSFGTPDEWYSVVYENGNIGLTSLSGYTQQPNDSAFPVFRMTIYNNTKSPIIVYEELNSATGAFEFRDRLVDGNARWLDSKFWIGAILSASGATVASASLATYSLEQNTMANTLNPYVQLPVHRGHWYGSSFNLNTGSIFAVFNIRMDQDIVTSEKAPIWISSVQSLCYTASEEWVLALYKNATLSIAPTWSINLDRVDLSTISTTATVGGSDEPNFVSLLATAQGGNGLNEIQIPSHEFGLFTISDTITAAIQTLGGTASFFASINFFY